MAALLRALGFNAFDLDPCSPLAGDSPVGARTSYTIEDDGLRQRWCGTVYCNPPYGRVATPLWTRRCILAVRSGEATLVVGLLPSRTDTVWWHENVAAQAHVLFLRGRLRFGEATASAPFPSAIALWGATLAQAQAVGAAFPGSWLAPLPDVPSQD